MERPRWEPASCSQRTPRPAVKSPPAPRLVDRLPQRRASRDAVVEPRCELFHLAFRSGISLPATSGNKCESSGTIGFGGLVVGLAMRACVGPDAFVRRYVVCILLDLSEDPRICRSHSTDHYGVASGLGDDGAGIFGRANIAVPITGIFTTCFTEAIHSSARFRCNPARGCGRVARLLRGRNFRPCGRVQRRRFRRRSIRRGI